MEDARRARSGDHSPKEEHTRLHGSEAELNMNNNNNNNNGETPRRRREPTEESARTSDLKQRADSDAGERQHKRSRRQSPSSDPRKRSNRSRSRSPVHRRNSRRSRSRSRSPLPHKRGDPRANVERNRQICYDYTRGSCSKGSSCKFIHDNGEGRRSGSDYHERDRARKHDEGHERHRLQEQAHTSMPVNGQVNHLPQPYGGGTSFMGVNGSQQQVWMPTPAHPPGQNTLYQFQLPLPPPPLPPFGAFSGVIPPQQQQDQDHHLGSMSLGEPLMEAISPDMPGAKQEEGHQDASDAKIPEPEMDKDSPQMAESGEEGDADLEGDAEADEKGNKKKAKKNKAQDSKSAMLVRVAVTECVKELLQPRWKEGKMSKDVYKTIAKKAVDKVVGTLQGNHIPKTPEKVDHFIEFSRQKISKLVQGYVDKYVKPA